MSNEKQETVADIVAQIRAVAYIQTAESPRAVLSFADRIEAAWRREILVERNLATDHIVCLQDKLAAQVCGEIGEMIGRESACKESVTDCNRLGNAAKMRDALVETQSVIAKCMDILNMIPGGVEYDGLIDDVADELCDLRESHVKPALSAPPRNCDLFDTKDKAREAFQKLRGHRILADVSLWDDRDEIEALFDWLFAKPKGETK